MYHVQLGYRFSHVLRRMLPIAMYLLQKEGAFLTGHDLFLKRVGAAYHAFLEDAEVLMPDPSLQTWPDSLFNYLRACRSRYPQPPSSKTQWCAQRRD